MKFNSIFIKLSSMIMVIFIIVLFALGFIINKLFTNFYVSNVEEQTQQISSQYAHMTNSLHGMNVTMVGPLATISNKKIMVADLKGKWVVNTGKIHFLLSQKALKKMKTDGKYNQLVTIKNNGHYYVSGQAIYNKQGQPIGSIFVFSSVEAIYKTLNKVRQLLILAMFGAFLIALGITYIISRRLSSPLIEMEQATRKMAKGDLSARVHLSSQDEIGSLAVAINNLAFEIENNRKTRQEFFANVSHELRTPVTYLSGYAKVLKEKMYDSPEEHDQYIGIIENEAIRLNRLIDDLFDLAKMEEGRISLNMEPIDLEEVLENVSRKLDLSAREKGLGIKRQFAPHVNFIRGDGERLEQVFINLINNAIRYTEKGYVLIKLYEHSEHVIVEIEDTGIGIPESELPLIFDRFYRIEKSRSREYGGTGLGLAIVKTLTEIQGGSIEVKSQIGKGTIFKVVFSFIDRGGDR